MFHSGPNNGQFSLFSGPSSETKPFDFQQIQSISFQGSEVEVSPVFSAYWYFAAERQKVFFRRLKRTNDQRLTHDAIISDYKFTNAYRASDRVSQYLIRNVIYKEGCSFNIEDVFFRILLFKLFNKIETWEALEREIGHISIGTYSFKEFDRILSEIRKVGTAIYSAAYIMPSAGRVFHERYKHQNHLRLIESLLDLNFPEKLQNSGNMEEAYHLMLSAPSLGAFLAYQFVTDINYSNITDFGEDEFVVPGPGALDGISKCFIATKRIPPEQLIRHMQENQEYYFDKLGLEFMSLWGRPLQLIDCQNLFCEISKYSRIAFPDIEGVSGRKRIKQKYTRRNGLSQPWYPPKWNINQYIG